MRRERREEARWVNEGEEHRGADQEGTRQTDRGRPQEKLKGTRREKSKHKKHKAKSGIMTQRDLTYSMSHSRERDISGAPGGN